MRTIRYKNRKFFYEINLETDDDEFIQSIDSFLNDYQIADKTGQNIMFEVLVNDLNVKKLSAINDDSFLDLYWGLKDKLNSPSITYGQSTKHRAIIGFINYVRFIQEHNYIHLHKYTQKILEFKGAAAKFDEGYEPILYSSFSDIPSSFKILIDISEFESQSNHRNSSRSVFAVDFSNIKSKTLAEEVLYYVFYAPAKFETKIANVSVILKLIRILDNDYSPSKKKIEVKMKHINAFKKVNENLSDASKFLNMSVIRSFLEFIEPRKRLIINQNLISFLQQHNVNADASTVAYTKEELEMIENELLKSGTVKDKIFWYLVRLQRNTPLRATSIVNLHVDCLHDINGHEKYEVVYSSKISTEERSNIDYHSAMLIKNAINEFIDERAKAASSLKKCIFVYLTEKTRKYVKIKTSDYAKRINELSEKLNINTLGPTGIRNYYCQMLTKYVINTGKDASLVTTLSRHSLEVQLKHYSDYSKTIENYENFYHVESIGAISLNIKRISDKECVQSKAVEHELGYCSSDHCDDKTMMGCFVCQFFRVADRNIPFYKEAISNIDAQITREMISHEKEFLITKKKILVKILRFLETKEDVEVI